MKRNFHLVFYAIVVAGFFVACSDGDVFTKSSEDEKEQFKDGVGDPVPTGQFKLGTCYATVSNKKVSSIEKNSSVVWSFKLNAANKGGVTDVDVLEATFSWNFGPVGAPSSATSSGRKSSAITYAASGTATTSVTASFKGGLIAEIISCAPLQVNESSITE